MARYCVKFYKRVCNAYGRERLIRQRTVRLEAADLHDAKEEAGALLHRREGLDWLQLADRVAIMNLGQSPIRHQRKRLLWLRGPLRNPLRYPAIERHHVYMAHMLAVHGIDVAGLTAPQLCDLELAGKICARCSNRKRCRLWLEQDRCNETPPRFCPNSGLFRNIATDQAHVQASGRHSLVAATPFTLEEVSGRKGVKLI